MKEIKKEYKLRLMEALKENEKWTRERHAAADQGWVTYYSPQYNKISFQVNNLAFGTCVFVNREYRFPFFIMPFGKLWILQRKMKKNVDRKILKEETESLQFELEK